MEGPRQNSPKQGACRGPFPPRPHRSDLYWSGRPLSEKHCALRLLHELATHQRETTDDERRILAHYSDFGESALLNRLFRYDHVAARYVLTPSYADFLSVDKRGIAYIGQHGELFPNAAELYVACQRLRKEKEAGTTNNGKHLVESDVWLTGHLRCEQCGAKLWHHFGGRNGSLRYYTCAGRSHRTCMVGQVRADRLEAAMLDLLHHIQIPPDLLPSLIDQARAQLDAAGQPTVAISPATIQAKLKRLALVYADGAID